MTIIAHVLIHNQAGPLRETKLSAGRYLFGSNFECDVVLLHPEVRGEHFYLEIEEDQIHIEFVPFQNDSGELETASKKEWLSDDRLDIGGLSIEIVSDIFVQKVIQSDPPEDIKAQNQADYEDIENQAQLDFQPGEAILAEKKTQPKGSPFAPLANIIKKLNEKLPIPIVVGAATAIGLVSIIIFAEPKTTSLNQANASLMDQNATNIANFGSNKPVEVPAIAADMDKNIIQRLETYGFTVLEAKAHEGKTQLTLYAKTNADRLLIDTLLLPYSNTYSTRLILGDEIRQSAEIILSQFEGNLTIHEIDKQAIIVDGMLESDDRVETIRNTLLGDIEGLKTVKFIHSQLTSAENIQEKVSAAWAGNNSYIILDTGRKIKLGREIEPGLTLVDISINGITIFDGTEHKEIEL